MPGLRFVKGHGTENDFVVLPDPDGRLDLAPALVRRICDRRAGLGADGVLRVVATAACAEVASLAGEAEWFMDYRNADGSLAEMCGNGVRVYARYLVDSGGCPPGPLRLATRHGIRDVVVQRAGDVVVDMGAARIGSSGVPVVVAGEHRNAVAVDMGNPHAVVLLDEPVDALDLTGPLEVPAEAFPDGANVEVVNVTGAGELRMRVVERGVGETRSCGTGACAAAAAAGPETAWTVRLPGGRLRVEPAGERMLLAGPAVLVASGELSAAWLRG